MKWEDIAFLTQKQSQISFSFPVCVYFSIAIHIKFPYEWTVACVHIFKLIDL